MTSPVRGASAWELVERRAEATPDEVMFEAEDGRQLTFGRFFELAEQAARELSWLPPGVPVVWQLPTTISGCLLAAALCRRGVIQVPVLPNYRQRELGYVVDQVGVPVVFMPTLWRDYDYTELGAALVADRPWLTVVHLEDRLDEADTGLLDPRPLRARTQDPRLSGTRWVFYTSGTTGAPKGVRHDDASLIAAAGGLAANLGLTASDRHAVVFPLTHVGGVIWILVGLMTGMPQLLVEAFRPETTIPLMRRFGVTVAGAGTAFHQAYLEFQRAHPDEPVFPGLRLCPGGAAPKPPHLHEEVKEELGGVGVVSAYGLTECPLPAVNRPSDPDDTLARTEGIATAGVTLKIVDPAGDPLELGGVGELWVRGPQRFLGYVDPGQDAEVLTADGWLRTGDLGTLDRDGHLVITGRLKDVILRKGESISAKEIEDLLHQHPAVAEVAVVGLPDEERGERVCAVVAPSDPASPPDLQELVSFLRQQGIMPQKLPEQLAVLDRLPRGPAGKVLKEDLRTTMATHPFPREAPQR